MAFSDTKNPLASLTIQGVIVSLVPTVLRLADVDLGADAGPAVAKAIDLGIQFAGAAMAIYGRWRANKTLRP